MASSAFGGMYSANSSPAIAKSASASGGTEVALTSLCTWHFLSLSIATTSDLWDSQLGWDCILYMTSLIFSITVQGPDQ